MGVLVRVGVALGDGFSVIVNATAVGLSFARSRSLLVALAVASADGVLPCPSDCELAVVRQPAAPAASRKRINRPRR